jgi:hypothetical protein
VNTFDDQCLVEVTRLAVRLLLVVPKRRVFEEEVARDTLEALSMPALAQSRNPRVHCIHAHIRQKTIHKGM